MGDETKSNQTEHINLKLLGQNNVVVQFKIKRHTPLRKLVAVYCQHAGLSADVIQFRYDGNWLKETDTPADVEMVDGDTIVVCMRQPDGPS
ncbi:small ubiquitin-related modifier 2-like [Anoplophora glabripennis]|uniref:small ubiquitin-related modifier 2-like n=1 Tax=Anoplophora glabripennis TaxID=217634 RepID=UPI0008752D28|nr:small ubiquitin-related modifier 2-like [Anoplophora glabripennis]